MRHSGIMWVGGGPVRRVRFWPALRGSPTGRRVLPVIGLSQSSAYNRTIAAVSVGPMDLYVINTVVVAVTVAALILLYLSGRK